MSKRRLAGPLGVYVERKYAGPWQNEVTFSFSDVIGTDVLGEIRESEIWDRLLVMARKILEQGEKLKSEKGS